MVPTREHSEPSGVESLVLDHYKAGISMLCYQQLLFDQSSPESLVENGRGEAKERRRPEVVVVQGAIFL